MVEDPFERRVTRRIRMHVRVEYDRDVPIARVAAEVAVTRPTPSKWARWAPDSSPVARVRSLELDTPWRSHERVDSVTHRRRESTSLHLVAANAYLQLVGEIVVPDPDPPQLPGCELAS